MFKNFEKSAGSERIASGMVVLVYLLLIYPVTVPLFFDLGSKGQGYLLLLSWVAIGLSGIWVVAVINAVLGLRLMPHKDPNEGNRWVVKVLLSITLLAVILSALLLPYM